MKSHSSTYKNRTVCTKDHAGDPLICPECGKEAVRRHEFRNCFWYDHHSESPMMPGVPMTITCVVKKTEVPA